jgi:hypothetical protein
MYNSIESKSCQGRLNLVFPEGISVAYTKECPKAKFSTFMTKSME